MSRERLHQRRRRNGNRGLYSRAHAFATWSSTAPLSPLTWDNLVAVLKRKRDEERAFQWHLNRARELDADVYCVYHACDSRDCPPGFHDDTDDGAGGGA